MVRAGREAEGFCEGERKRQAGLSVKWVIRTKSVSVARVSHGELLHLAEGMISHENTGDVEKALSVDTQANAVYGLRNEQHEKGEKSKNR